MDWDSLFPIKHWLVIAGAIFMKVLLSENHGWLRAVTSVAASLFSVYAFTDIVVEWLGWDSEAGERFVVVALALTGEEVMRAILKLIKRPDAIATLIRAWRGK